MKIWSSYLGLEFDTDKLDEQNGTYEYQGQILWLTQDPHIHGTVDAPYFTAIAVDEEGKIYKIIWDIKPGWDDDDWGNACNWDKYSVED